MAHIEKRNRGGQTSWRARYRAPDGRERSRSFAKKSVAEQWLDATRGDLAHGTYVDPAGGKERFGEYARAWQGTRVHRPSTAVQVDSHMRNHILPRFEDRPLGSIRRSDIQSFVKDLSTRLRASSVEVVYRHLASIFKSAVADRLIAASPCDRISLPKVERKRVVPLETEQVLALGDALPDRYRALVVLAAGTGLRQGEAFGLTVPHVDFLRRRLDVVQQLVLVQNRPPFIAPPKTDASVRSIPLPQSVADALARHLEQHPPNDSQLVFTNERGDPISRTRFSSPWRRAVKEANVPHGTGFHSLRHYYASLLIRHGESVKVVQARLGHASAAETLDTYSHLWPDSEDTTREAVDAVLNISRPNRGPRAVMNHVSAGHRVAGGEPACTPDSVPMPESIEGGHPSRPAVARRLQRPTREIGARRNGRSWTGRPLPVWPCSGWGLPSRPGHPGRWCALTAPFHPYLCGDTEVSPSSAVCSLWHFPAGHPDWALPSTLPCGVRTFLGPVPKHVVRGHPAGSPPDDQSRATRPTTLV